MHQLGMETGADLKQPSVEFLTQHFGKAGAYFYGIDNREVQPDRERKSIDVEGTFPEDVFELETAREQLLPLVSKVCQFCSNSDIGIRLLGVSLGRLEGADRNPQLDFGL